MDATVSRLATQSTQNYSLSLSRFIDERVPDTKRRRMMKNDRRPAAGRCLSRRDAISDCNACRLDLTHRQLASNSGVLRYATRCYSNVRSKADMSQLNLPHGNDNLKV